MRGFIDRARDYLQRGVFSGTEVDDVRMSLDLYNTLRTKFSITEEDIENVENVLSLADLGRLLDYHPIKKLSKRTLSDHVRRFIDAVITKSWRSRRWLSEAMYGVSGSSRMKPDAEIRLLFTATTTC